jgi:murein DD-endopeptidase MepM/ murein hydrolase activator NlpD
MAATERFRTCVVIVFAMLSMATTVSAMDAPVAYGGAVPQAQTKDHISDEARQHIWEAIDANVTRLRQQGLLPSPGKIGRPAQTSAAATFTGPGLGWPLRNARGNSDAGYWVVSNYLDQNRGAGSTALQDHQCRARTYDNHQGTDISLGWDGWNVMERGEIEVIAAAPGTIVLRQDGNFDRNCMFSNKQWNAVYVRHDDGSVAWYGHLKNGSVTPKQVGARVAEGEYLGLVGSSGNSSGPHLHFELYDAGRRLVDPFAGPCNALNIAAGQAALTWWKSQRPYLDSQINRVYTASAPPVFSTCGADGTLAASGNTNEKRNFKPGDTIVVGGVYRDQQAGSMTFARIRRPDGTVFREWMHTAPASYIGSYWYWTFVLEANAPTGTWMVEMLLADNPQLLDPEKGVANSFTVTATGAPVPNYSALWWNPNESGWGVNIAQQSDTLFAVWYTYDNDGTGMWLVMPSTSLQADGRYVGKIYRTTGIALADINGQTSSTSVTEVGTGSFSFAGDNAGTFTYTVGGTSQSKNIIRQVFARQPECRFTLTGRKNFTNYQDLWWTPAESGWGLSLTHQGDTLFAAWYTYRADGKGQWLVGPNIARQLTGEFTGRVYRTTGVPFANINMMSATGSVVDVGEMTFTFADGENADMVYTVDGRTQRKRITRQTWAPLRTACQ